MIIKTVIEVHKLLGACQVLMVADEDLSKFSLQLSVTPESIILVNKEDTLSCITFCEVKLKPQSISGLTISENSLFFRVQIENENNLVLNDNKGIKYIPPIEEGINSNLLCICCKNVICKDINFKRILPLPSVDDWNYDDWFCHKHSNCQNENNFDRDKLKIVSPDDCLYNNFYVQINTNYLKSKKLGVIHCDKCLSWIGKKTANYARLWNSSVKFEFSYEGLEVFPLNDFNNVILNKINNSPSPVFKIIVSCPITNDSIHYLLLRVMDKNLTILMNFNSDNCTSVNLSERKVVKVLYKYLNHKNETVQTWFNDPLLETVEVSKQMLNAGFKSLISSSRLVAKPYRFIDSMSLGYLQLV